MKKHNLFNVDLERKTALCAACGHVEIFIPKTRTRTKPKAICINKARELWLHAKEQQKAKRIEKQSQPDWKPRHLLSEIDPGAMTAICAVCGPTDIRKITRWGYTRYDCLTKTRVYMRKYRRSHYVGRSTNPHALSNVDEENQMAVCEKCGPVKIEIYYGKKKMNRRCINARMQFVEARKGKSSLSKIEE